MCLIKPSLIAFFITLIRVLLKHAAGRDYNPATAMNQLLINAIGPPLLIIALVMQATAQIPTRPEATPIVMIPPRETVSMADFEVVLVLLFDLIMLLIIFSFQALLFICL